MPIEYLPSHDEGISDLPSDQKKHDLLALYIIQDA